MTADAFVEKWQGCQRNERAAAQEHFINLCALVGADTPNAADPTGDWYAFEEGAEKIDCVFRSIWAAFRRDPGACSG